MKTQMNGVLVDMEEVFLLHFPKEDVLFSKDEQEMRSVQLAKIAAKGKNAHFSSIILFQDIEGMKTVNTTIEGVNANEVILTKGIKIPTQRILNIDFL